MSKSKDSDKSRNEKTSQAGEEKCRIIVPEIHIMSLKEHFGDDGYDGQDVLDLIGGPERPSEEIVNDIAATIENFNYRLPDDEVPLVATKEAGAGAVKSFCASMPHYNLKTLEDTPAYELCQHLDFMAQAGLVNDVQHRDFRGDIYEKFGRQAQGKEVIILGDLDKMSPHEPAQRFLDGAFFNLAVESVNGYSKAHVREHLTALREEKPSPHRAKIIPLKFR